MVSISFKTLFDQSKADAPRGAKSGIHSGNGGDLIYSLPTVKALGIRHLILNVYRSPDPLRKLTYEMASGLAPLLLAQEYLDRVSIVTAGVPLEKAEPDCIGVDYILDQFRNENFSEMHLMQAHARALHVEIDANEAFLTVPDSKLEESPDVVLSMTPRYRALTDEFIRELGMYFDRILVIGIPDEWRPVAGISAQVYKCRDFLELAQLIRTARLFIGNPSLPSAIAEGLKTPRIVDLPPLANAFPVGPRGYVLPAHRADFYDMVRQLCPDNLHIRDLYEDLRRALHQSWQENEKLRQVVEWSAACLKDLPRRESRPPRDAISLLHEAERGQAVFSGGFQSRFALQEGIFLHPTEPGRSEARIRFSNIDIAGYNSFESDIEVNHKDAQPVRFIFRLYDAEDRLLFERWKEISSCTKLHWSASFTPIYRRGTIELATRMAEGATSEQFAWAWFRNPEMRAG